MSRINVTKAFLPQLEEYEKYLREIWSNDILTNQGPLLKDFEKATKDYLGISNFHFVSNGTIALQIALRALDISEGEVITTPFSYVASVSSILWERCEPVFVDIDPDTFSIDANKIEEAITPKTKAIMPVHVFGIPCDVEKIEVIARKHNIKVIYDGAHAFGVEYKGKSLLSYGDISTCSFHATKLFHTIEGGAIITRDIMVSDKVELLKRFGHTGDEHFTLGINAKASEFQAAMGLCNLKYTRDNIEKRQHIFNLYDQLLGNKFQRPTIRENTKYNYAYYPILFASEQQLLQMINNLNRENIFPRRYFYPSLNTLPYLKSTNECVISEDISKRIMSLPLYAGLKDEDVRRICQVINL
ncbi:MAG TPA: DegT/DnrJ/EryC1/StrS family aminotransferase [Candidatus Saccharimonadales bacterium]